MAVANQHLKVWKLCEMWNCTPWELMQRPTNEVLAGMDYLAAQNRIALEREMRADAQDRLDEMKKQRLSGNA